MIIGYSIKPEFDFGLLEPGYRKGTIEVDDVFWKEYVKKRFEFEKLHIQLVQKLSHSETRILHKEYCRKCQNWNLD